MSDTRRSDAALSAFNSTLDALLTAKGIVAVLGIPTIGMVFRGVRGWLFNDAVWVVPVVLWLAAVLWAIRKDRNVREQKLIREEKEGRRRQEREELEKIASFAERLHAQERFSDRNRWLELESRRDAYVRVCRRLTPSIYVADRYQPKILVTLTDSVPDFDSEVEYFSITPSENIGSNKWVADKQLGKRIRKLQDDGDVLPQLGIIWADGSRGGYDLYKSFSIQVVGSADYRAILEPKDDLLGRRMTALASVLALSGYAAAELAGKDELFPRGRSLE